MPRSTSLGPVTAFAAAHHGVITRRQAAELGLGRMAIARLIERNVLREAGRGVLVVFGSPSTWEQRLYIATMYCNGQGIAIGRSAARLHGVDGFQDDDTVHVTFPHGRKVLIPGARVSQTAETYPHSDVTVVAGIRCAGLARTICDIASLEPDLLERATDHFQRRGYSLTWLARTAARLRERGRPGIALVDHEIERRAAGPTVRGSWFEKLTELCLSSPLLPGLERQYVIRDGLGAFIARVDLALPCVRLAIEAHSRDHHTGPRQQAIDERRERQAVVEGWLIEYLGWSDVLQTPDAVCRHIERVAARRAADLGVDLDTAS